MTEERNEVRLENKLLINIDQEGFESMGLTENISKTGMSVITTTVLPIKSPVSLQIGVADDTFSLKGKIMWSKKSTNSSSANGSAVTGIKITEAPERYLKYVERLLSEN
ncbi:MAG: PilZ domain-containing protein [Candidatus Aminicenantes bacterium]|nr:PilZ domain-containing protein [Candidatus Aminicenantes bacterium]